MLQFPHSENVFDNGSDTYPGLFHERIFHRYSNSIEIRFYGNCIVGFHISPNFCTCHDSIAVVPCAQFRSDHLTTTQMGSEWNFHRIWITMENSFMKWAPGHTFSTCKDTPLLFPQSTEVFPRRTYCLRLSEYANIGNCFLTPSIIFVCS